LHRPIRKAIVYSFCKALPRTCASHDLWIGLRDEGPRVRRRTARPRARRERRMPVRVLVRRELPTFALTAAAIVVALFA
jgi:hypothetical protein